MWYPPANEWQTNTKRSNRNRRRKVFAEMNKQNEENRNKAEKKHKSIRKMLCNVSATKRRVSQEHQHADKNGHNFSVEIRKKIGF